MPQQMINLPQGGTTPPTDLVRGDSLRAVMEKSQSNFSEIYTFDLAVITARGATTATPIALTSTQNSTGTSSGALRVSGGVGIGLNLSVGGNLTVSGNLIVNGTQTVVNSTTVSITDPVFHIGGASPPTVDDNFDRGIAFHWHDGTNARAGFFGQKDSGNFVFIRNATETTPNVFIGPLGTIEAAAFVGNVSGSVSGSVTGNVSGFALSETLATVTSRGSDTTANLGVGSRIRVRGDGANFFWLRAANGSEPAASAIGIGMDAGATAVSSVVFAAGGLNVAEVTSDGLRPVADNTYDLGAPSRRWRNVYATNLIGTTTAVYADLAERYAADAPYPPGTLVIFGGEQEITTSGQRAHDTRVAGVVSTQPGMMLNSDAGADATHPYIALTGRVPCLVTGTLEKGDLLVASDVPGHAMRADDASPLWGRIIGRAIHAKSDPAPALIEIAIQRG
jgi:hypothetical protein